MSNDWQPMKSAPEDTTEVLVKLKDGTERVAHFACNMSGDEQPAFCGWFTAVNSKEGTFLYYREIQPIEWRPINV